MADDLQRIIRLEVDASKALGALDKLGKSTANVDKNVATMTDKLQKSVDSVKNVFGVLAAGFATFKGVKAITDAGDQIRQLEGSFTALLGSAERARDMMQEVFGVAANTGAKLEDVAGATQRLSIALADAGASNEQIAQLSENFIKIGRIGGSSMADVTGALTQFTQALASGRLQGDELRSILERVPLVGKAIAKELGVSVGALKELGSEGKLTADVLVNALLKPTADISKQFAELPVTMEQAFNQVSNTATQLLANIDQVAGISRTIAIVFDAIGANLAQINGQVGGAEAGTSGWRIAVEAVGNAFRGVLIVVNSVVGGIAAVLTSLKGLATAQVQLIDPREWKNLGKTFTDTVDSVRNIRNGTLALNQALALGTAPAVKTAAAGTRDWESGMAKLIERLKKMAEESDKAGKKAKTVKPPDLDEWDRWLKSLEETTAQLALTPIKLQYLNAELEKLSASGDSSSVRFRTLKKAADELTAAIDPVAAAMQKFTKAAEEQSQVANIIASIEERMRTLADAGKLGSVEFKLLGEELSKLKEQQDPTGATKLVNGLIETELALGNLQVKFDAITVALEQGLISAGVADRAKNELLGISDAADKATDKAKSLSQAVAEAGAKFVTDFADKLIDSLGKAETSFGSLVESMLKQIAKLFLNSYFQQFIKLAETSGNQGGFWGAIAGLFKPAAKGAAFDTRGMQFFADGGVVTHPTLFAHGAGFGVMGEAGAEAIVPLRRDASGDLGVKASPTIINVNNNNDSAVTVSERTNSDGSKEIDIAIERKVRNMIAGGKLDSTMRSAYGISRQPVIG